MFIFLEFKSIKPTINGRYSIATMMYEVLSGEGIGNIRDEEQEEGPSHNITTTVLFRFFCTGLSSLRL